MTDAPSHPREEGRDAQADKLTIVLLVLIKESEFGFFAGFGLSLIGVHAGLTVHGQHFAGFAQTEVRGKRRAEEFLHSVENGTQSGSHFEAIFHGSGGHDLRGHDTAIDNRNSNNGFVVADQGNEHNHADPNDSHG